MSDLSEEEFASMDPEERKMYLRLNGDIVDKRPSMDDTIGFDDDFSADEAIIPLAGFEYVEELPAATPPPPTPEAKAGRRILPGRPTNAPQANAAPVAKKLPVAPGAPPAPAPAAPVRPEDIGNPTGDLDIDAGYVPLQKVHIPEVPTSKPAAPKRQLPTRPGQAVNPVHDESLRGDYLAESVEQQILSGKSYADLGVYSITSEDLMQNDYAVYGRLQDKVQETKLWIQEILKERDMTKDIAAARQFRGEKFLEMAGLISRLLAQRFAADYQVRREDAPVVISMVINEMLGLGPIEPLWDDSSISEIMVNGPGDIFIERRGKIEKVPGAQFRNSEHLMEVCQQILSVINKTIDVAHPLEDGRLPDGSRVNISHPAVGPSGPFVTIRRFPETVFSIKKLVELGSMTPEIAEEIGNLITWGCSVVIVGGTGTGKTSMLNALSGCIPNDERIISIEDNLELRLHPDKHWIAMEARKSHQGEKGNVSIRDLVRNALRQRPDRIVVGEVRDGAAFDMLQAMSTGHDGSLTTVHANNSFGAVDRLVNLIASVGEIDSTRAMSLVASAVDLFIVIERFEDGSRRVVEISEVPSRLETKGDERNSVTTLEPNLLWQFIQTDTIQDEEGRDKIIGEYQRVGELSENIIRTKRLDKRHRMNLEEIYERSENTK